jgi:Domain of unknown function (DUF222)
VIQRCRRFVSVNLVQMRDDIRRWVSTTDPGTVLSSDAVELTSVFSDIERAACAAKLKMALRVEECGGHKDEGHKNSGTWLSSKTGDPTGKSITGLEAARAASRHPSVEEAFKNGDLSVERVRLITGAADLCPREAEALVEASPGLTYNELHNVCDSVREAATSEEDEIERNERTHSRRFFRSWTDPEGAGHIQALLTPDALGVVLGCLKPFADKSFEDARKRGVKESHQAYMADGLVEMAKASSSGEHRSGGGKSKPLLRIRADLAALRRGYREKGERCEIPGVGAVPVSVARRVLGDSFLELVITDGIEVSTVVTNTRTIKRALLVALEERDFLKCCVPGCDQTINLQYDHYLKDFAKGGLTCEANLLTYCSWHHQEKTKGNFVAEGTPGNLRYKKVNKEKKEADDRSEKEVGDDYSYSEFDVDVDPPPEDRLF